MNCCWLSDPGSVRAALSVTYSSLNPSALVRPWMPSAPNSSLTQAISKKGTHKAENQLCFKCQHSLAPTGCQRLNLLQSLKTILLSWQSMTTLPLLHSPAADGEQTLNCQLIGERFSILQKSRKVPYQSLSMAQAGYSSSCWRSKSTDSTLLLHQCFQQENYGSKQKSGTLIYF